MKSKKVLLIVISIIIILLLALGGVAFAYFTTDFLKTDEQLFCKYAGQVVEKAKTFDNEKIANYFKKMETTPYENNGKLSVNIEMPEEMSDIDVSKANNVNITFSGKTDKTKNLLDQKIQLNYSDEVSFPVEVRKVDNMVGITSELVINKFIAVDLDRIEDLLEKIGMSEEDINIEELLSITETKIDEEKIKTELEKYKQIFIANISSTNFSKVDENTFALTLNEQETVKIIVAMLNELKTSEFITEDMKEQIEEIVSEADTSTATTEEFIKVLVNKQGIITVTIPELEIPTITIKPVQTGLEITLTSDEINFTITLEKTENANQIAYNINLISELPSLKTNTNSDTAADTEESSSLEVNVSMVYTNIETQNATEQYIVGFSITDSGETVGYEYTFDTNKTFVNNVQIEELNSDTAEILNDIQYDMQSLFIAIIAQIQKVNTDQMQQLGIAEDENPLIYALPGGYYAMLTQKRVNELLGATQNELTETEKQTFNVRYTSYRGTQSGTRIRNLIAQVRSNNLTYPDRIVTINGISDDEQLEKLDEQIEIVHTYTVSYSINEVTGLVDAMTVTY